MFILTTIEDLIQIAPQDFSKESAQAIKDAINIKYANKVIHKVGLCITMWDMLKASEGLIGHGTGLVNVNVEFRMVVLRPFRGEILHGRIKSANEQGMVIDLDFTYEVFVPHANLFEPSHYDPGENAWVWSPPDGEEFFFDKGETVLLRVEREEWFDQKPSIVQKDEHGNVVERRGVPWRIIASMNQSGLGPCMWWESQEGEEEEGEQQLLENGDVEMDEA
ncbi:DNA-directed RNA polymerase III complex subunit Rpc25 [Didymosphaeria variabile]|uniref:DNA-directed RNA polymerase subunit n=1 Tax=Didymosphaeria variabile TaxID=1932322 RepID=A0A9W9C5T3_9PLEO|nr:DNA-directed RNA polymerase III complex subunit Rpc25 [Didymosphaeria variabile]KAJ4345379.1 DNA-directed RNA polymerase III complex subunit Rpc25 [Didymosphaeria variabile]